MLLDFMKTFTFFHRRPDDSLVDRLNYYHTATLLLTMALLVSFKMFGGRPIECWLPAEYSSSWEEYAEIFCWAQNTYWLPYEENLPIGSTKEASAKIFYYQWVPFFFLLQALLFYAPNVMWKSLNDKSGIKISTLVSIARDKANIRSGTKEENLQNMANYLISTFRRQFKLTNGESTVRPRLTIFHATYFGSYMSYLYIVVKVFYLVNSILQIYLINLFLQTNSKHSFGWDVMANLLNGTSWEQSGHFPRAALCDLQIRVMGNLQYHTVQCVLVINVFTEKIFVLLWLWFFIVAIFNCVSLFTWTSSSLSNEQRVQFVEMNIALADPKLRGHECSAKLKLFINDCLKKDGVFVLRMLAMHAGSTFTAQLVNTMWQKYKSPEFINAHMAYGRDPNYPKRQMAWKYSGQEVTACNGRGEVLKRDSERFGVLV